MPRDLTDDKSTLVQIMACWLTAPSKPLPETMLTYQSSQRSSDIHLTVFSQKMPQPSIAEISSNITCIQFHSNLPGANELTHWGLVMPFGDIDFAWRHQAITWINVDLSSVRPSGIHLRTISLEIPLPSITKISLKINSLKVLLNLPGPMS